MQLYRAAERGKDARDLRRALGTRGQVLLASNRAEEAVVTLQKVVELPGGDAYAADLASAQILAGRPQEGIETLTRALAAAEADRSEHAPERLVLLRMRLADGKLAAGDRDAAVALLKGSQPIAVQTKDDGLYTVLMDRLGALLLEVGIAPVP